MILTIVSNNYIHFARSLMESVKAHEPEAHRYVLVLDVPVAREARKDSDLYTLITLEDLNLPTPSRFLFRYNVLEANTAVKPWAMEYLSRVMGYDAVIYLDPDIYLYRPLTHIHACLRSGATLVLTPHITGPLWDSDRPNELDILRAGVYNLGFVAIGQWTTAKSILSWWQLRLEHHCIVEPDNGLFVDQRWMDLAPGLFEDVHILRHKGYNVAYWNLHERPLSQDNGGWLAGGVPVHFFHFSGIEIENSNRLSKHQTRFCLNDLGTGRQLVLAYCERLRENGADRFKSRKYGFSRTRKGVQIPDIVRRLYRRDESFQRLCGDDPFSSDLVSLLNDAPVNDGTAPHLTRLMRWAWQEQRELQEAYPDPEGNDGMGFMQWYASSARDYFGIPDSLIEPVRMQLANLDAGDSATRSHSFLSNLGALLSTDDSLFLHGAYRLLLDREVDAEGRAYYMQQLRRRRFSRKGCLLRLALSPECRRKGLLSPRLTALLIPNPLLRLFARRHAPGNDLQADGSLPQTSACSPLRQSVRIMRTTVRAHNVDMESIRVAGYFDMNTGVGESARRCVAAAQSLNFRIEEWQIEPDGAIRPRSADPGVAAPRKRPPTLLHVNADQVAVLGSRLNEIDAGDSYRIGYWHWEMPIFPAKYMAAFQYVDEVWAPSTYIVQSLLPVSPVPVVKIPHCIELPMTDGNTVSHTLQLQDGVFSFLVMYDMCSYEERKNPIGAINAYLKAFPEPGKQTLLVKVSNADFDIPSFGRLQDLAQERSDIVILSENMDRRTVYALQAFADCLVSLHRSEGFGLCPAECMYLGKPVIATGWSGNMEFMTAANSYLVDYSLESLKVPVGPYEAGQYWAEPDEDHAASLMRKVRYDDADRTKRGLKAASTIRNRFSPLAIAKRYRSRLSLLSNPP